MGCNIGTGLSGQTHALTGGHGDCRYHAESYEYSQSTRLWRFCINKESLNMRKSAISALVRGGQDLLYASGSRGYSSGVKPITATLFPGDGALKYQSK